MKKHHIPPQGMPPGRRIAGRAQGTHVIDTYKLRQKLPEPTLCPQCAAVWHEGRWQWMDPLLRPRGAHEELCTACHRINDQYPAGAVTLKGGPVRRHRDEFVRLARNQEEAEKAEHPLNRIMAITEDNAETLTITTTDIHLPRRIGEAVERAFHGRLELKYDEEYYFIRVEWQGEG